MIQTLENASLEQLGNALTDLHSLRERDTIPNETEKEVARRVEFSKQEAGNLLDIHFRKFKKRPSCKHWAELYAAMTCHQGLSIGGFMENLAKD